MSCKVPGARCGPVNPAQSTQLSRRPIVSAVHRQPLVHHHDADPGRHGSRLLRRWIGLHGVPRILIPMLATGSTCILSQLQIDPQVALLSDVHGRHPPPRLMGLPSASTTLSFSRTALPSSNGSILFQALRVLGVSFKTAPPVCLSCCHVLWRRCVAVLVPTSKGAIQHYPSWLRCLSRSLLFRPATHGPA